MAGLKMTHVPYKGIAPAITAQLGNEVQLTFSNVFSTLGHWKAGRLRLVAHGGSTRAESFPDIPTISESGLPGYESNNWYGYVAAAKTPRAIIRTLNQAFVAAVNQPDVRKTLVAQGNDVIANTPEEFAKVIRADAERWGGIGRKLGIKLD
jgi:tripartite-type tricarboxylate transporter receptor subunit TctC